MDRNKTATIRRKSPRDPRRANKARARTRARARLRYALGIDPGETHLGMALVLFDPRTVDARTAAGEGTRLHTRSRQPKLADTDFQVRWVALWDVKEAGGGSGSLQSEIHGLQRLVHESPLLRRLLGDPRLSIFCEIQEGGDWASNPGLAQSMMRTGSLSSALLMLFVHYGHHVEFVGKRSRWGWTSYEKTPEFERLNTKARRQRVKACITLYVRDLVRRQQWMAPDGVLARPIGPEEAHDARFYWRLASYQVWAALCGQGVSFEDSAHYSDGVAMAMFGLRRLIQPGTRHRNVIEAPTWETVAKRASDLVPAWSGNLRRPSLAAANPSSASSPSPSSRSASANGNPGRSPGVRGRGRGQRGRGSSRTRSSSRGGSRKRARGRGRRW